MSGSGFYEPYNPQLIPLEDGMPDRYYYEKKQYVEPRWSDNSPGLDILEEIVANNSITKNLKNSSLLENYAAKLNSTTNENDNTSSILCGFPGFCKGATITIYKECSNVALLDCQECGIKRAIIFLFFVICLRLTILIGNLLVLYVGYKRRERRESNKMDICRSSLAAADIMTSIKLLVIIVYNFSWIVNLTPFELDAQQLALRGSTEAFIAGIFQVFGFTASLYHLIYMGMQRLYAISKPLTYRMQSKSYVRVGLGIVWFLALVAASVPAFFPGELTYTYQQTALIFSLAPSHIGNPSIPATIMVVVVLYLVPYVLMTSTTVATGILIFNHRKTNKLHKRRNSNSANKQHLRAYLMVALMQIAFTFTQVPVAITVVLLYSKYLNCSNISQTYMACMYLTMANSIFNVIIYNVCDKTFRNTILSIFNKKSAPNISQTSVQSSGKVA